MVNKTISLLKQLEWVGTYSYCTGWPCCPSCHGIKPGHGRDAEGNLPYNQGHKKGCLLKETLDDATRQDANTIQSNR